MTSRRKPPPIAGLAVNRRLALDCLLEWAEGEIACPVRRCWKHVDNPDADVVVSTAQEAVRSILWQVFEPDEGGEI